jgi:hypothetical protein
VARQTRTLADMVALPDESPICEIFGGDLVVKNVPDANHAFLIIDLIGFLIDVQDAGHGYVFSDRVRWPWTILSGARRRRM